MTDASALPRGIRNNNPGNIRLSSSRWLGQKRFQLDLDFVEFEDPVFGLRALMRLLLNYHVRHGLDTITGIINRYAPPCENVTGGYIHHVCRILRAGPHEKILVASKPVLVGLARAICLHENGFPPRQVPKDWYADAIYDRAADIALNRNSSSLPSHV